MPPVMIGSSDGSGARNPHSAGSDEAFAGAAGPSIDPADVARFSAQAAEWWDPKGPFAPLHRFNPARLAFLRDRFQARFGRSGRGAFAGLSLYGYTTKKNLSGMGSFMVMGLIGIIVAMVINIFLQSSALQLAISVLGVVIFAGLTAYDTQRLRQEYYMLQGTEFAGKAIILGALTLYLDFINMFQFLLSFLGNRE